MNRSQQSAAKTDNMQRENTPNPFVVKYFLTLFVVSLLLLGLLLWPFFSILIVSFILVSLFKPVYTLLTRKMSTNMASLLTCLLIIILVFVPLVFFVGALSAEAIGLYKLGKATNFDVGLKLKELIEQSALFAQVQELLAGFGINLEPEGMNKTLSEFAKMVALFLYGQATSWAANIMNFVISFFMMIIVIFFLLIDNERLADFILKLSPLPDNQERQLISKFREIAGAILIGNGICGLVQGILGGVAFTFFGLGSPILWGGIMVILAFLPIFGIGLVLVPAALILFLKGRIAAAIIMLVFYAILSFSVEYLLKPKMVGKQVQMPTLLVFLSILGGLSVFGVLGIIYGPLIVTAFLTLSEIYLGNYDMLVKDHCPGTDEVVQERESTGVER
jgi:predicted PurR-regulated permease PerM